MVTTRVRSGPQFNRDLRKEMGDEAGDVYYTLQRETHSAFTKWYMLARLGPHNDLGEKTSFVFVHTAVRAMWASLVLDISRLTDPGQTRGNRNASLFALPNYLDEPEKTEVFRLAEKARQEAEPIRGWRNKRFAHYDIDVALSSQVTPLDDVSLNDVESVLNSIATTITTFQKRKTGKDVVIHWVDSETETSVNDLTFYLLEGIPSGRSTQ